MTKLSPFIQIFSHRRWYICLLALLCLSGLWSADTPATTANLPPGLSVCQMTGNLVCPPVLVAGKGILLACDDRSVSLIQINGQPFWRLEMDRGIRGQLSALSSGMVLVNLSGGQLACISLDGHLLWQRRLPGSEGLSLFGSPDGRIIQIDQAGKADFLNPNGGTLFHLDSGKGLAGAPKYTNAGIVLNRPDGSRELLDWVGNLRPVAMPDQPISNAPNSFQFSTENKPDGSYAVRLRSNEAALDFSSRGSIGHWLADHGDGITLVWGDSLWRCFIYRPQLGGAGSSQDTKKPVDRPADPNDPINPEIDLEAYYLKQLWEADPIGGPDQIISLIQRKLAQGRLAGRIGIYESILERIIGEQRGRLYLANTAQRIAAIQTLAAFPSLRQLDWLLASIGRDADPACLAALIDYARSLAIDPGGKLAAYVVEAIPVWQANGQWVGLKPKLLLYAQSLGLNWRNSQGLQIMGYLK